MNLLPIGLTEPFGTQQLGDRVGGHHYNYPRGNSLKHSLYTLPFIHFFNPHNPFK